MPKTTKQNKQTQKPKIIAKKSKTKIVYFYLLEFENDFLIHLLAGPQPKSREANTFLILEALVLH
jgi:hypothetical protein